MLLSACQTNVGLVREHNEDSYHCDDELSLWVVADGMGGHLAGECASRIAVDSIASSIQSGLPLSEAIQTAHKAVLQAADGDSSMAGMGSTVVAAHLNGDTLDVAWVGDSRAYLWNGKKLFRISRDHSIVQDFIDRGVLTEEEAMGNPNRGMITQAVGPALNKPIKVASISIPVFRYQKIMLCSDGLTDLVVDQDIAVILAVDNDVKRITSQLIQAALDAGGTDNVTVICAEMGASFPSATFFSKRKQRLLLAPSS